jgi:MFS family permease
VRAALAPLRERPFRLLFLGRLTSLAGTAIAPIALAFAVLDTVGEDRRASSLGLVLATGAITQIVFLLYGGVIADRLPRNLVMTGSDVVAGACQLLAGALVLHGSVTIWQLAVLNGVRGAASAFFFPAAQGLTPQTVPNTQLQEANALLRLTFSGTNIVGAAAGGIAVAAVGPGWGLVFDGLTYLLGAAFVVRIRVPVTRASAAGSSVVRELREGWAEFSGRIWLWTIVLAALFSNMAGQSFNVLGPVIAKEELGGADAWGAILASFGGGFLLGGLLAFRVRPQRPLYFAQAIVVAGVGAVLALALGLPAWGIAIGAVVAGAAFELFGVFWELSLQQHVPQEALSRVSSYDALGSFVAVPLGLLAAGPVADAIGVEGALWCAVALFVVPNALCLLVPDVRRLGRTDLAPDST